MPGKQDRFRGTPVCVTCGHRKRDHAKWDIFGWFIGLGVCNYNDGCEVYLPTP